MSTYQSPIKLKKTLCHNGFLWNQAPIVTKHGLMETRCLWDMSSLEEASVHCDTAQPRESQESTVMPWNLGEASVNCKHSGTHGSHETIVTLQFVATGPCCVRTHFPTISWVPRSSSVSQSSLASMSHGHGPTCPWVP